MDANVDHRPSTDVTLTERHPALMSVVLLLGLVVVGGFTGLALGRVLVLGVQLLLGPAGQGG